MLHMSLRLLLVDDHDMVREGLTRVLERAGAGWDVRGVGSGHEALTAVRESAVDVAIVDLSMPGMSGLELIRRLHSEFPKLRILVLSMHAEEQYALRALKAGAVGYVNKSRAAAELVHAVRKIAAGGVFISEYLAEVALHRLQNGERSAPDARLSNRELDIFRRIAAGERITEIAEALNLSVKTVSTHKSRIQDKLGVTGTAALVRYGVEQGLVPGSGDTDAGGEDSDSDAEAEADGEA
jgi:DNA-binding NarL/FixJ family response regulator